MMLRRYHEPPGTDPDGTETEPDAPQADKPAGRSRSQPKKKEE
ncbi:hypothetical protein [Streptomyces sp. MBT53]|nr:hypothetical protein [Streptomyces sp. MBT53]